MASLNRDDVRIQVKINKDTPIGKFNDAMYFTKDQFDALTNQEVNDKAQERVQNWRDAVRDARQNARQATKAERIAEREARREAAIAEQEALDQLDIEIARMPDDPPA